MKALKGGTVSIHVVHHVVNKHALKDINVKHMNPLKSVSMKHMNPLKGGDAHEVW